MSRHSLARTASREPVAKRCRIGWLLMARSGHPR